MSFFAFDEAFESAAPSSPARPAAASSSSRAASSSSRGPTPSSKPVAPPARRGSTAKAPVTTSSRSGATPATSTTPTTPSRSGATTQPARTDPRAGRTTPAKPTPSKPVAPAAKTATAGTTPSGERKGFDFSQFTQYLQQGIDFAKFGVQVGQQFAGARGPAPSPAPATAAVTPSEPAQTATEPVAAPQPGVAQEPVAAPQPGSTQLAPLLQALQQRQIPPLPGSHAGVSASVAPSAPIDGLAMLQAILSNPQFQHTMQSAAMGGGARSVYLPMPTAAQPQYQQPTQIPLAAVLNAVVRLAGRSMSELNAATREEEPQVPEYLVDEQGEYLVDPASADDRAALVAHMFRVNAAAAGPAAIDESEAWAEEAGFI